MDLIWLIPILPLIGFLINGLLAKRFNFSEKLIGGVGVAAVFLAFLLSLVAFFNYSSWSKQPGNQAKPYISKTLTYTWIAGGKASIPINTVNTSNNTLEETSKNNIVDLSIRWAYQIDHLSALYALFVTFVGLLIHIFSIGYMHSQGGFARFFAYLNLFMFMMLTLVLGSNLLMTFVGWEGVGLCSYLLIGFYMTRKEAAEASKKAFIINRIGDLGFILAIIAIFSTFGTVEYQEIARLIETYPVETLGTFGVMSFISLGLFIGATGKSAQFPLYIWLPDAMAGPTPVSALIHAATMVTAGIYLLARMNFIFERSLTMMLIIAIIGVLTAFIAATIAITQKDIKKILAYSTISQLGFMFLSCGVGAFVAGVFHVLTHAFFKAQLFLGAGSVIHAMKDEQDITKMGGLKKYLPTTYKTMVISWLAICGIAPLAGFWSKDEILAKTFSSTIFHPVIGKFLWFLAFLTAGITAFYMTRLMALTFWSEQKFLGETASDGGETTDDSDKESKTEQHQGGGSFKIRAVTAGTINTESTSSKDPITSDRETNKSNAETEVIKEQRLKINLEPSVLVVNPKESPLLMTLPLVILAFFAATAGFIGLPIGYNWIENWLKPIASTDTHLFGTVDIILALVTMIWSGAMAYFAYHIYVKKPQIADDLAIKLKPFYQLSANKWYWDDLLDVKLASLINKFNNLLGEVDRFGLDAIPNGSALITRGVSILSGSMDRYGLDLLVNLIGWFTRVASVILRTFQTGFLNNYALVIIIGLVIIIVGLEYQAIQEFYVYLFPATPKITPTPTPGIK
ncbi:MAG: NADH-quinone oxidoreductase subunit L [Acidobacteria bacterium]|nr:NADH-quinone oxidoreductase subunit L [Acidobacteriota bacterium]